MEEYTIEELKRLKNNEPQKKNSEELSDINNDEETFTYEEYLKLKSQEKTNKKKLP